MDTSVVGIYKSSSNAQSAMYELQRAGFSQSSMQLTSMETSGGIAHSLKEESGVGEFFRTLYGREDTKAHAQTYEHAASQGNAILTVHAPSEDMAHRAADVMQRFGPIDVEEYEISASGEGKDDLQKGRRQPAGAAAEAGPSSSAEPKDILAKGGVSGKGASATRGAAAKAGASASPEGKDDLQKGGHQSAGAAAEEGPSATAERHVAKGGISGKGATATGTSAGTSSLKTGTSASGEGKDDLQKGRRQSAGAAAEAGPSAESGVRMYQRSTGVPIQRPSAVSGQGTMSRGYDDSRFRNHWQSKYGSSGGTYDEYDPAYRYGSGLRSNERWKGKQWSDMEPDVRKDWEARNPKGLWEKFKDTIRYGWENPSGTYEDEVRSLDERMAPGMGIEPGIGSRSAAAEDVQKGRDQPTRPAATAGPSGERGRASAPSASASVKGGGAHVPDDVEYRSHWQHNYWTSGGSYDDYAPAYRYGADYADNDTNPNHQWKDVEARMRSDWNSYNNEPGSWDKNVEAIRYGWEKGKQRASGTHSGESLR